MSQKQHLLLDSESGETDIDELRAHQASLPQKPKTKGDLSKRLPVGFFILSFYVLSYYAGIFYQALFAIYLQIIISSEALGIARKPWKDAATSQILIDMAIWTVTFWGALPYQILNYKTLQLSGVTKLAYPTLYSILFEYHTQILLILFSILVVLLTLNLTRRHLRYQLAQTCFSILICGFASVGASAFSMISMRGRFWYFFPQQCIGFNDTAAYAFGKMFGRTKLIKVSPSKTVEGFIGGMVCNVFQTWYFSGYMLQSATKDFWICGSQRYDLGIFENYTCESIHTVFQITRFNLPFSLFGMAYIDCLPAQFYCVIFGIFASLIGPFAGFFASGLKRAYGIKDFANTFPGHGGFLDRFDCQVFSVIFCATMLHQFIFRQEIEVDSIVKSFDTQLSTDEQAYILEMLASLTQTNY